MTSSPDRIDLVTRGAAGVSTIVVSVSLVWGSLASGDGASGWIRWVVLVLVACWWLSPLVLYLTGVETLALAIGIGVLFPIVSGAGIVAVFKSDSSTAGIGLISIPVLLWSGMFGLLLIEQIAIAIGGRFGRS